MIKMIEAYHPEDSTPLFVMQMTEGKKGNILSDAPIDQGFILWPEQMIDDFLHIVSKMCLGEIASYNMCLNECLFCDTLRQRIHNGGGY